MKLGRTLGFAANVLALAAEAVGQNRNSKSFGTDTGLGANAGRPRRGTDRQRPRQRAPFAGPGSAAAMDHGDVADTGTGTGTGTGTRLERLINFAGGLMVYRAEVKPMAQASHARMVESLLNPDLKHPLVTPTMYYERTGDAAGAAAKARWHVEIAMLNSASPFARIFGSRVQQQMSADFTRLASEWHVQEIKFTQIANQQRQQWGPEASSPHESDNPFVDPDWLTAVPTVAPGEEMSGVVGEFDDTGVFTPLSEADVQPEQSSTRHKQPSVVDSEDESDDASVYYTA